MQVLTSKQTYDIFIFYVEFVHISTKMPNRRKELSQQDRFKLLDDDELAQKIKYQGNRNTNKVDRKMNDVFKPT